MDQATRILEAAQYIASRSETEPRIGLILGSGLGDLADEIQPSVSIKYADIPHFPVSTVEGHAGRLVLGQLSGEHVVAMQGRFHYYEGYPQKDVAFPVYVMKELGVSVLMVTNACGGMNPAFAPGDLMLITDHINFTGGNPLIGPNDEELGPRFPDMSEAYDRELILLAQRTAGRLNIQVQKGVYVGISGPSYMTPAELTFLARVGGDTVGMSTVPEVIAARHAGLRVLGISCVTDMAIGAELEPLTHEQVIEVAEQTKPRFIRLLKEIVGAVAEP